MYYFLPSSSSLQHKLYILLLFVHNVPTRKWKRRRVSCSTFPNILGGGEGADEDGDGEGKPHAPTEAVEWPYNNNNQQLPPVVCSQSELLPPAFELVYLFIRLKPRSPSFYPRITTGYGETTFIRICR